MCTGLRGSGRAYFCPVRVEPELAHGLRSTFEILLKQRMSHVANAVRQRRFSLVSPWGGSAGAC